MSSDTGFENRTSTEPQAPNSPNSPHEGTSDKSPKRKWLIAALAGVVVFQIGYAAVVFLVFGAMDSRGQFGDIFGGANALFTGLAFAGVVYTILLQRNELELQREELRLNRAELSRTAEAQIGSQRILTEQATLLRQSTEAQIGSQKALTERARLAEEHRKQDADTHSLDMLSRLSERFESERGLRMRGRAAELLLQNIEDGKLQQWSSELVEVVDLLNFFEWIGFLTNNGILKIEHVANTYGPRVRVLYRACEPAIKDVQSKHGRWTFLDLENLYSKIFDFQKELAEERGEEFVEVEYNEILLKTFLSNEKHRWNPSGH